MKIISAHRATLPLLLAPVIFSPLTAMGADEQTLIVSATQQTVSELDTPAAVSVVNGDDMRHAAPRINLSESLGSVRACKFRTARTTPVICSCRCVVWCPLHLRGARYSNVCGRDPGDHARRPGQTSNIDLSSVEAWKCCVALLCPVWQRLRRRDQHQHPDRSTAADH